LLLAGPHRYFFGEWLAVEARRAVVADIRLRACLGRRERDCDDEHHQEQEEERPDNLDDLVQRGSVHRRASGTEFIGPPNDTLAAGFLPYLPGLSSRPHKIIPGHPTLRSRSNGGPYLLHSLSYHPLPPRTMGCPIRPVTSL
jgi:hypothetical protein